MNLTGGAELIFSSSCPNLDPVLVFDSALVLLIPSLTFF